MSIKSYVHELESVRFELKSLSAKRKKLKEVEKGIENKISEYLKAKDQPGVKGGGVAILIEPKATRERLKEKEKNLESISILKNCGIKNPDKVLKELLEARKGQKIFQDKLVMKKYKEK